MKKGSGGRITSLTLEKKGGWEGGREREGWLGDASGNAAAPAAARIRRADGGGPANWKAAESRVSQSRAVAAALPLIAPGAAAGKHTDKNMNSNCSSVISSFFNHRYIT